MVNIYNMLYKENANNKQNKNCLKINLYKFSFYQTQI